MNKDMMVLCDNSNILRFCLLFCLNRNNSDYHYLDINVDRGIDIFSAKRFHQYLNSIKLNEEEYLKKKYKTDFAKSKIIPIKYSTNITIANDIFKGKRNLSDTSTEKGKPFIFFYCGYYFINMDNIVLVKFFWIIARLKNDNWKHLKDIENLIRLYADNLLDEQNREQYKLRLLQLQKFYDFLLEAKNMQLRTTFNIAKSVITRYIKDRNIIKRDREKFKKLDEFEIFNCDNKILKILKRFDFTDVIDFIFREEEKDLIDFFN